MIASEKKPFYTVEEVADLLSINKNTIYSFIKKKKLKAVKLSKKMIRIKVEDLEEFLSSQGS